MRRLNIRQMAGLQNITLMAYLNGVRDGVIGTTAVGLICWGLVWVFNH